MPLTSPGVAVLAPLGDAATVYAKVGKGRWTRDVRAADIRSVHVRFRHLAPFLPGVDLGSHPLIRDYMLVPERRAVLVLTQSSEHAA